MSRESDFTLQFHEPHKLILHATNVPTHLHGLELLAQVPPTAIVNGALYCYLVALSPPPSIAPGRFPPLQTLQELWLDAPSDKGLVSAANPFRLVSCVWWYASSALCIITQRTIVLAVNNIVHDTYGSPTRYQTFREGIPFGPDGT